MRSSRFNIAKIYSASPVDGAPKWGIRSHSPQQLVGLEGQCKSQGLSAPGVDSSAYFPILQATSLKSSLHLVKSLVQVKVDIERRAA